MNTITLPLDTLKQIPPAARIALFEALGFLDGLTAAVAESAADPTGGPSRFSDEQIRSIIEGVNPQARKFLEAMSRMEPSFLYKDLLKALNVPLDRRSELGGVWAGLTKRIKTVTGSPDGKLVKETDWKLPERTVMTMHPETHAALRRVFASSRNSA